MNYMLKKRPMLRCKDSIVGTFLKYFFVIIIFLSGLKAKSQSISEGLVQYYPFTNGTRDESNHSAAAKVVESNFSSDMHGYIEGSPTLVGNGYYIEFPDSVKLGAPGWTYSIWFKLYALPTEVCDGDAFLLSYKTAANGDDVHLFVDDEDNRIKVFFKNGGFKISTGTTIQKNNWYHVTLRYTASTTDVFVNGSFAVSSAGRFSQSAGYVPLMVASTISSPINKGRIFGNIDDLRMYKRNLSNAEINLIYNSEKNMSAPLPKKDTVYIRDTVIVRDTVVKNTIKLDTLILGGNCMVYPNPIQRGGQLHIDTNDRPTSVTIYNALGQFVKTVELTTQAYIVINDLAAGVYYLKISSPSEACGKRIVVN
jgi:hypothetical protein